MAIGDNEYGDVTYGDVGVSSASVGNIAPVISGIYAIGSGGMLIDYVITETSNSIYDLIGVYLVGMIGRKIR